LYGYVGNDPTNGIDSTGLFLDSSEAAIGLLILTAALAAPEIANAPAPCDDTYPNQGQGPGPLILGIASAGAGQWLVEDVVVPALGKLLGGWIGGSAAETAAPELGVFNRLPMGPGTANADEFIPQVLQTGSNTLKSSTLRTLGLTREQGKNAIEALKRFNRIPPEVHSKILSNGDVILPGGEEAIDNIFNYVDQ
jgi:hypothetical protein